MARDQKFTDDELRQYMALYAGDPAMISKIAKLLKVSIPAVSKRVAKLEKSAAPQALRVVKAVERSVFDVRGVFEDGYGKLMGLVDALIESEDPDPDVLVRALKAVREYGDSAMKMAEAMYRVEEVKKFQEAVLGVLGEADPALRAKVLDRLKENRAVRAGFVQ